MGVVEVWDVGIQGEIVDVVSPAFVLSFFFQVWAFLSRVAWAIVGVDG